MKRHNYTLVERFFKYALKKHNDKGIQDIIQKKLYKKEHDIKKVYLEEI